MIKAKVGYQDTIKIKMGSPCYMIKINSNFSYVK